MCGKLMSNCITDTVLFKKRGEYDEKKIETPDCANSDVLYVSEPAQRHRMGGSTATAGDTCLFFEITRAIGRSLLRFGFIKNSMDKINPVESTSYVKK